MKQAMKLLLSEITFVTE